MKNLILIIPMLACVLLLGVIVYLTNERSPKEHSRDESLATPPPAEAVVVKPLPDDTDKAESLAEIQYEIAHLQYESKALRREIDFLREQDMVVRSRLAALTDAARPELLSGMPASFTERFSPVKDEHVSFNMVLVPGDPEKGVEPFYMSMTEVTWEMMRDWAYSMDITSDHSARLQILGLRPSEAYPDWAPFMWITARRPAMALTYRTAVTYCLWLSKKTGRTYRVPTMAEWQHALELGGGVPRDRETLLGQARLREGAELVIDEHAPFDPFADLDYDSEITMGDFQNTSLMYIAQAFWSAEVGTHQPNALGLYDMLGNAAEWVTPDDRGRNGVVGGHYLTPADELHANWVRWEDPEAWNATYPQRPASQSWYYDFPLAGLRLVCEPVNIPRDEAE